MVIKNDLITLKVNEQGQINSIIYRDHEMLRSFSLIWPNIENNLWKKITWEWIRDKNMLTLLATHFSDSQYQASIDIQCFIKLEDNKVLIETLLSNVGLNGGQFDLITKPLLNFYDKKQTEVQIYYENHHDIELKSGKQWKSHIQIVFSDIKHGIKK